MRTIAFPTLIEDKEGLTQRIPLLSPKHLNSFSPEEYKEYVRSLLNRPQKKEKTIKLKTKRPDFVWSITPLGNLSLRFSGVRKPKWISREEIEQIVKESKLPANAVWLAVLDPRKKIKISTKEEEEKIKAEIKAEEK